MLANVATHLISRAYDPFCSEAETKESYEQSVASLFYEEAQSVCRNCYIFNTEVQVIVGHAHKVSLSLWRHTQVSGCKIYK